MLEHRADLALGSRFLGQVAYSLSPQRRLGMRLFGTLASLCTRQRITDATSGFQAMNHQVMAFYTGDHYANDYPDADTLIRLVFAGFRLCEVPVTVRPRRHGTSMHSGVSMVYYVYKMLLSIMVTILQRGMFAREGPNVMDRPRHDRRHRTVDSADDHSAHAP